MLSLHALVLIVGLLFITNFNLKKPGNLVISGLVIVVAAAVLHILHIW